MVGWQVQEGRDTSQLLLPVGQLRGQDLATEPLPLPLGKVGILQRMAGHWKRLTGNLGLIQGVELAPPDAQRPGIGNDVVHIDQQYVVAVAQDIQRHPQRRPMGQVERTIRFLREPLMEFRRLFRCREVVEIDHVEST